MLLLREARRDVENLAPIGMSGKVDLKAMRRAAKRHAKAQPWNVASPRQDDKDVRKQMKENARLAAAAAARESAKLMAKEEERHRQQVERDEMQRQVASLLSAASSLTDTPKTEVLLPPSRQRRRPDPVQARPVWAGAYDLYWDKSFEQLKEETSFSASEGIPSPQMSADAFRNGLTIVRSDYGGTHSFSTCGLQPCPFARGAAWQEMASKLEIVLNDKGTRVASVRAGGTGLEKVGAGTYNLVMRMRPGEGHFRLPGWLADRVSAALGRHALLGDTVLRITRNDCGEYSTLATMAGEVHNAIFASIKHIGPPLFAVAPLAAPREARGARYASVQVLRTAHCDLAKALENASGASGGVAIAIKMTQLLFEASALGVLFLDIKPANVLGYRTRSSVEFRLADTDPQFFLLLDPEKRDWKALLLANLALLSAHVRNLEPSSAADGFLSAVKPVLRELVVRRSEYASDWLFAARAVEVSFDTLRGHSDFELQRILCTMTTSYFYGSRVTGYRSCSWPQWDRAHQDALNEHWKSPANRACWPASWSRSYRPLVQQLVEFACGPL